MGVKSEQEISALPVEHFTSNKKTCTILKISSINMLSAYTKIFIFPFFIFAGLQAAYGQNQKQTELARNVVIYYAEQDSNFVKYMHKKVTPKIRELQKRLNLKTDLMVTIILKDNERDFLAFSGQGTPEWAQAIAILSQNTIVLKMASGDEKERVVEVTLHELVHIFLNMRYPGKEIPTWVHEGLAQKLSGAHLQVNDKVIIANALYGNYFLGLDALDSLLSFNPVKARLGYALAYTAVDYFDQRFGLSRLLAILDQPGRRSFYRDFKKITGREFVDFEFNWYAYVDKTYRWMILLNIENIVFLLFVILLFGAFFRVRKRNKQTIGKWEEPEDKPGRWDFKD